MAIYDRCFLRRRKKQSQEEQVEEIKKRVKQRYMQVKEVATSNRTKKERAIKLKSMKKYLYGKYLVNVPRFSVDGRPAIPLPESSARPVENEEYKEVEILDRKYGQHLTGDMIPTREFQLDCLANVKARKKAKTKAMETTRFPRLAKLWGRSAKDDGETELLLGDSGGGSNYQATGQEVLHDCRCR